MSLTANYSNCTHPRFWRAGWSYLRKRGPVQRFVCAVCGWRTHDGADHPYDKAVRVGQLLRAGWPPTRIEKRLGMNRNLVMRIKRLMEAHA